MLLHASILGISFKLSHLGGGGNISQEHWRNLNRTRLWFTPQWCSVAGKFQWCKSLNMSHKQQNVTQQRKPMRSHHNTLLSEKKWEKLHCLIFFPKVKLNMEIWKKSHCFSTFLAAAWVTYPERTWWGAGWNFSGPEFLKKRRSHFPVHSQGRYGKLEECKGKGRRRDGEQNGGRGGDFTEGESDKGKSDLTSNTFSISRSC